MILVTGATGYFGKAAIDFLLKKGVEPANIAALVRDEAKATDLKDKGINIRKGDYDDYNSLVQAFAGVDKLLLVSGSDLGKRAQQQANAVRAAKEASVKHILYTSFERKTEDGSSPIAFVAGSHLATEKEIKKSGIPYTIFRNTLYMDYVPIFIGEKVLETGIFWPAGAGKAAVATRQDMAEAAVNAILNGGSESKEYSISSKEKIGFADVADILSKIAGKPVPYLDPSNEEYKKATLAAGVPAEYVDMFAAFAESIKQNEFETSKSDLETLLGRKPTTLAEYLQQVYG